MMKRIGIEINGVLRDTIGKFTQVYEKHMIEESDDGNKTYEIDLSGNTEENTVENNFEYKIINEVTSLELMSHFAFKDSDELYSFMYEDFVMQIFGHAGSTETFTFNELNDFYINFRDDYEIIIVSDEMGRSKPASLFFLSKFGCLVENIKFYSNSTLQNMWDGLDILVSANPKLIENAPENKTIVKYETPYNKNVKCEYEIDELKKLNEIIKNL
jgi:hypothetical protein